MTAVLQFSNPPRIDFDFAQPLAATPTHCEGLSGRVLSEAATDPPLSVLECLSCSLRSRISSEDFHSLRSQKDKERVTIAFEQRYSRIRNSEEFWKPVTKKQYSHLLYQWLRATNFHFFGGAYVLEWVFYA